MKSSILLTISMTLMILLALSTLACAQDRTASVNPPISQPLVREGTFALRLADAFKLGPVSNEAEAETALSSAGIAPRNGWIADYPVTPDIVGELQTSVTAAADSKSISLGKDEALKAFQDAMSAYDLTVKPSEQIAGNVPSSDIPDQTVINNYYYDEGPPVVTYYAPPLDYAYLYTWVPYPFLWWDFWFPGFFVLADFDIDFGHGHFRHHHGDFDRDRWGGHFSNHFRDPKTGTMSVIDAARRSRGTSFTARTGGGWTTTAAQNGARSIFNRRTGGPVTSGSTVSSGWNRNNVSPSMNNWNGRTGSTSNFRNRTSVWNAPRVTSQNTYSNLRPNYGGRTYAPSWSGNRINSVPRSSIYSGGSVNHTVQSRSGSSFGGWHSGGSVGRSFGGWHSSSGGMRSFGGSRR